MKRTILAIAAALFAVLPAAADDIEGVYKGTIWSGDHYPGTTIFTISETGLISGTYIFQGDSGPLAGDLTSCRIEVRMLRCTWQDDYGAGDFMALFSSDFRSFEGGWWETMLKGIRPSLDDSHPWSGKRAD